LTVRRSEVAAGLTEDAREESERETETRFSTARVELGGLGWEKEYGMGQGSAGLGTTKRKASRPCCRPRYLTDGVL